MSFIFGPHARRVRKWADQPMPDAERDRLVDELHYVAEKILDAAKGTLEGDKKAFGDLVEDPKVMEFFHKLQQTHEISHRIVERAVRDDAGRN